MADQEQHQHPIQETLDVFSSAEPLPMFDGDFGVPLVDNFVDTIVQDPSPTHHVVTPISTYDGNGFSGVPFDENACNASRNTSDSAFGNPIHIPIWPVPPSPLSCSCCQSLRELFHINGTHVLKLDIHGRLGMISHAVLEKYNGVVSSQNHEYHMFDFSQESIASVKEFLVQYCNDRKREGYVMLQDPLSNFYNALCIGIDDDGSQGMQDTYQEIGSNQPGGKGNSLRPSKSFIASQRERTGKMTLRDLAQYFHLPINDAAKEMNICPSAIKSICRKEGLRRWPYRKIKSIESKILRKQQSLSAISDENERGHAISEIQQLQQKLARFYEG